MLQRRHLSVDGLRLSFLEQGHATAGQTSLLVLHGLMGSADTFASMVAALPEDLHVVVLDFPGSGLSERRDGLDGSMRATAELVERFAAALNLPRISVLGHSHGGAVALRLARSAPQLVDSLVLFAPAHPYFRQADPLIRFYLSLPGKLFAYSMPWYPRWIQMIGLRRMAGPLSWDTPERLTPYRESLRVPGTISHLLRVLRTWHADMAELRKLLRTPVDQPTLVVWGDCDRAVPATSFTALNKRLRDARFELMTGVGHRPAEERALEAAELVAEWMKSCAERATVYSPNSAASQSRSAVLMTPSFDSGD